MKLRRLQRQDPHDQWYDDAYAFEDSGGAVIFRYNLTWDRVGSACNKQLQESGVSLEAIETVIQLGERFRWLPVEVIADNEAKAFLESLDNQCAIPKPRPVVIDIPIEANFK